MNSVKMIITIIKNSNSLNTEFFLVSELLFPLRHPIFQIERTVCQFLVLSLSFLLLLYLLVFFPSIRLLCIPSISYNTNSCTLPSADQFDRNIAWKRQIKSDEYQVWLDPVVLVTSIFGTFLIYNENVWQSVGKVIFLSQTTGQVKGFIFFF